MWEIDCEECGVSDGNEKINTGLYSFYPSIHLPASSRKQHRPSVSIETMSAYDIKGKNAVVTGAGSGRSYMGLSFLYATSHTVYLRMAS